MEKLFVISTWELWGDYGRILISGVSGFDERENGRLRFYRTGPFSPPLVVTLADNLIATEAMRSTLKEVRGISGFLPVIKQQIVALDWHLWDLTSEDIPRELEGEPEQILLSGPHDREAANALGELYEVQLEQDGMIQHGWEGGTDVYRFRSPPTKRYDLFHATTIGQTNVAVTSERFLTSLSPDVKRWLRFTEIRQ